MSQPRKKQVDWTKLESYVGMSWPEIRKTMQTCGHMLAFGDDQWAVDVVKTFRDYEPEAAMAALTAALFLKKHGASATATTAVNIYREVARELKNQDLLCRVENLAFMVYFADHSGNRKLEWPIPWPYDDTSRRAGLANVMLGLAMQKLVESRAASTCESVAAFGIQRFLDEGMKKYERGNGKKGNRRCLERPCVPAEATV